MLIFTRRPGEALIETPAGEQIEVTVLSIKGNQVRIGTDAPDDVSIVREDLLEGLQSQRRKFTQQHKKSQRPWLHKTPARC